MNSRYSRAATALSLVASLWVGAISVAASPQQKEPEKTSGSQTQQKPDDKTSTAAAQPKRNTENKSPVEPLPQPTGNKKPLSSSEDPSQIGKRKINGGFISWMGGSLEKEVAMGRQLAAEVDREAKFIDDPVITEYVNRVGQNLVLHSDAKVPFTIKVIDSDEVNAFALPGGFFYVNKGLILAADNEAELAGVMAHEIAHVAARHAVENQAKGELLQYGAIAGSIFLGGVPGLIFNNTAGLGLLAAFLKFSRGAEEEADRLGVQYLYASGYDPTALATMFEKLSAKNKKKPGFISKAFATHPQPPDRRAASLSLVGRFPEREEYVVSSSEFQRVKGRLLRMSNAMASTAGDISGGNDGAPGRPTLKRRNTSPDNTSTDSGSDNKSPNTQQSGPPKLKRNGGSQPAPSQPTSTP